MNPTQATLDAIKSAAPTALPDELAKGITQATGLVAYDLEPGAKLLYPVLTPLRNEIPRVKANGGTATNWKQITAINTNRQRAGVSEGNRGGVIATSVVDKTAAYRGIGLEDFVTFEADDASQGFDDAKAIAVMNTLNAVMIQEERFMIGGNTSLALGVTPTPSAAASASNGTLASATYSVICVALTLVAMRDASVSLGILESYTRTNADGSTDNVKSGAAQKSAAASAVVTGPTGSIGVSVAPVNGAVGYAWFWGVAGSEVLGAVTSLNSYTITATATGTQAAAGKFTADDSIDSLAFDGLLTQIMTPGSGAYVATLATGVAGTGTALSGDGAGGVTQIETALASFWDNYRLSPDKMRMSGATLLALNKIVIANGGAPLIRYNADQGGVTIDAGVVVGSYLNKVTNTRVKVEVHPDLPSGVIMFSTSRVPYPLNGVANIVQMKMRREYYSLNWPRRTRKDEFGVYADGVLQNYFPPAFGVIRNIAVS
jgi:hypothetical protein